MLYQGIRRCHYAGLTTCISPDGQQTADSRHPTDTRSSYISPVNQGTMDGTKESLLKLGKRVLGA